MHGHHACRQFQIGDVERGVDLHLGQIDFHEGRKIFWQAADIDLIHHVSDNAAGKLDRRRNFSIREVQWHFHVNLLVRIHTLEVGVKYQWFECMHLEITQQHFLGFAIDFEIENR